MHALLVAFGALVIATATGALLTPLEVSVERPYLPSLCVAPRLSPIVRPVGRSRLPCSRGLVSAHVSPSSPASVG